MFLFFVEFGLVIFVGVIMENFLFEFNNVLLFRVCVYVFKVIDEDVLSVLFDCVLGNIEKGLGEWRLVIVDDVCLVLIGLLGGDGCRLFIYLELVSDFIEGVEIFLIDIE